MAVELDTEPRVVAVPDDLASALAKSKKAQALWDKMSYTHKREYVEAIENSKRPETRKKWIAKTIEALSQKPGERNI